jgi:putative flippase GtrA
MVNIYSNDKVDRFFWEESGSEGQTEAELTRLYGDHTLAFFGLALENEHFVAPDGLGLVNYRLMHGVAVVAGDPVCAPEAVEEVTRSFLKFCDAHCWRVAFYQARPDYLSAYSALKLSAFKMGEEAIISPQSFTLQGSAMANVRTTCRRGEREGVCIHWYEGVPPAPVMQQIERVSDAWLASKGEGQTEETGFSTGRFGEIMSSARWAEWIADLAPSSHGKQPGMPRFVTGVALTSSGEACAFVTFTPIYGTGRALDLMRRAPDAPPGVIELLLVRAIERFREEGAQVVSLGLAAWADSRHEMSAQQRRLASFVTDRLGLLGSPRTLFSFKQKFNPCWESRYLVTNTPLGLPRIALAVLDMRNYSGGLTHLIRKTLWQFLRYCLVGGANTLIDLLAFNILLWRFPTGNAQVLVGYNSIAYMCGAATSFFFNKYWTFRRAGQTSRREVTRFIISLLLEIIYSNGLIWLASKALQPFISNVTLWGDAAKVIALVIGMVISYTIMRFWTFSDAPKSQM